MAGHRSGGSVVFLMVFVLSCLSLFGACAQREEVREEAESVYVPEFTEVDFPENCNIYSPKIVGDSLYYGLMELPEKEEPAGCFICEYSPDQKQTVRRMFLGWGGGTLYDFFVTEDGWVYAAYYPRAGEDEESFAPCAQIHVFDGQGKDQMILNLSDYGLRVTSNAPIVDKEKRMYLPYEEKVLLIAADGTLSGEVALADCDHVCGAGVGRDGAVYVSFQGAGDQGKSLAKLDYETRQAEEIYFGFPDNGVSWFFSEGTEYDFVIGDSIGLYGYSLDTQTSERLLEWMDSDINGESVLAVCSTEDDGFRALFYDRIAGCRYLVSMTKQDARALPEKTELTLGTLQTSGELEAAVSGFNRQSPDCRVSIRTYLKEPDYDYTDAVTALNADIVSGDGCPDILNLSGLDAEALTGNGVFEDIAPYLEKSSMLAREDYLANILESYTYDGILVAIPRSVTLQTFTGRAAEVGERGSWTLEEMLDCAEGHPGQKLFSGIYQQRNMALTVCMQFGQDVFIDPEEKTCHFDSEEFQRVLSFIAGFPADLSGDVISYDRGSDCILYEVRLADIHDLQFFAGLYGDEAVTFIGYPTADGSGGHLLETGDAYALSAQSEHKDAAWSFIEYYLARKVTDGFPTNQKELLTGFHTVEYEMDDNGQYILDQEGKPWPKYSSVQYDGGTYDYHPVTEEETALLMELLEAAKVRNTVDKTILQIIREEAEPFFQGQKTARQASEAVQNRVRIYLEE